MGHRVIHDGGDNILAGATSTDISTVPSLGNPSCRSFTSTPSTHTGIYFLKEI